MRTCLYLILLFPALTLGQSSSIDSLVLKNIKFESESPVHSILLYIESPDENFHYNKGFGKLSQGQKKVSKNDQFRIASITKLFVSTVILQLEEEGKLSLNDQASKYLENIEFLDFDNFHIFNHKYYSNSITIKQLLSHRSGLADIFNDRENEFFERVITSPNGRYNPESIVNLYYEFKLNKESHFEPGKGWRYSDMNYVLLGLIIEQIDNSSLANSIRRRILQPLNLQNTFFEYYENIHHNKSRRIDQYIGKVNFTKINTSFDWSGGGLVSTNKDLATFIKSLFNLEIISKRSLDKMIDVAFTNNHENRYGLGIYETYYNEVLYFGHYGYYGTYVGYSPEDNTVISYSISQANPAFNIHEFICKVLKEIPE